MAVPSGLRQAADQPGLPLGEEGQEPGVLRHIHRPWSQGGNQCKAGKCLVEALKVFAGKDQDGVRMEVKALLLYVLGSAPANLRPSARTCS